MLGRWFALLSEWDRARQEGAAAVGPDAKALARWRLDEASAAMWKYKDEMARGFAWCLRWAAEYQPDDVRAVVVPIAQEAAGDQGEPYLAALRGRVLKLERQVEDLLKLVAGCRTRHAAGE